jgi:hypothetical protein
MHILFTNNKFTYVQWADRRIFNFFQKRGVKVVKVKFI